MMVGVLGESNYGTAGEDTHTHTSTAGGLGIPHQMRAAAAVECSTSLMCV